MKAIVIVLFGHYVTTFCLYAVSELFWQSYQEVNQLFCDAICRVIRPGDKVWIQDYQLMLLPGMLRKVYPDLNIGYFHHIPFPSYELSGYYRSVQKS